MLLWTTGLKSNRLRFAACSPCIRKHKGEILIISVKNKKLFSHGAFAKPSPVVSVQTLVNQVFIVLMIAIRF